jgi:hypothetical protein
VRLWHHEFQYLCSFIAHKLKFRQNCSWKVTATHLVFINLFLQKSRFLNEPTRADSVLGLFGEMGRAMMTVSIRD